MRQLKKKSFMNEDSLQNWINKYEIDLVSVTNTQGGVTAWYYDTTVTTIKGSDLTVKKQAHIGGVIGNIFNKK